MLLNMMVSSDQELKISRMCKRSQRKNIFSRDCYKLKEFVLTPTYLKYFEISGGNRGKEKCTLLLNFLKFVEKVQDEDLDNKKNVFQIAYVDDILSTNRNILYIVANSAAERDDWINLIRYYAKDRLATFLPRYHPGIWKKPGRYSCCDDINRRSMGCQVASPPGPVDRRNSSNTNGNFGERIVAAALANQGNGIEALGSILGNTHNTNINENPPQSNNTNSQIVQSMPTTNSSILQPINASQRKTTHTNVNVSQKSAAINLEGDENSDKWVIAVHNYNPVRENQLPLQKGERYFVVDSSNSQWWYVKSAAGDAGYVPTNYIHKPNSLTTFDWYYKDLTRQQAESILLEENREGCFLVRDSVSKKNTYTLSVTSKDPENAGKLKVHHYHFHHIEVPSAEGGAPSYMYYLSEKHAFQTISDVIHYHKHNSGGLVKRLRSPPMRDHESPVTAGMGLDEFELDPAELKLNSTPIGKGQFGVVKKGEFRRMPVAVKQMVEGAMNEDDFIDEAKNMRFLNHPNLVQLFGVVMKKRPIMIITEYMKYGSLRDFLRNRSSDYFNRPVVLADICAQVAKGMAYLELENFVHRDLAARNCLVKTVSRRSVQVKVADFGMARFLLDNVYEPSAGTKFPVRWAPPEVFQSIYTPKADVWSFGVLMWEVFTCCTENPYHGKNNSQVYQYIIGGGRLTKPVVCPDRLYVLMLECWQHDPKKRPAFEYVCQKIGDYLDQNCEN